MRAQYKLARERRQEARELRKLIERQNKQLSKLREKIRKLKGEDDCSKPCPRLECTVIREDQEYWASRVDEETGWAYVRDLMCTYLDHREAAELREHRTDYRPDIDSLGFLLRQQTRRLEELVQTGPAVRAEKLEAAAAAAKDWKLSLRTERALAQDPHAHLLFR